MIRRVCFFSVHHRHLPAPTLTVIATSLAASHTPYPSVCVCLWDSFTRLWFHSHTRRTSNLRAFHSNEELRSRSVGNSTHEIFVRWLDLVWNDSHDNSHDASGLLTELLYVLLLLLYIYTYICIACMKLGMSSKWTTLGEWWTHEEARK